MYLEYKPLVIIPFYFVKFAEELFLRTLEFFYVQ